MSFFEVQVNTLSGRLAVFMNIHPVNKKKYQVALHSRRNPVLNVTTEKGNMNHLEAI